MNESTQSSISDIRTTTSSLKKHISHKISSLTTQITNHSTHTQSLTTNLHHTADLLLISKTNIQTKISSLHAQLNNLQQLVKEESAELKLFETENNDINIEIKKPRDICKSKEEVLVNLECEMSVLKRKLEYNEGRRADKEKEYKERADLLRDGVKFDIVPVRKNVVRVVFDIYGEECWFVIDFESGDGHRCVVDTFPVIMENVKLNKKYKEINDFHRFARYLRKEFVKIVANKVK